MSFRHLSSVLLLGPLALLAACNFELGTHANGEKGNVEFSYISDQCLFGCALGAPLMLGTRETISLDLDPSLAGLRAESSDESVVAIALSDSPDCCTEEKSGTVCLGMVEGSSCTGTIQHYYSLDVTAAAVGEVEISILRADGSLLDRTALAVHQAAKLALSEAQGSVTLPANDALELQIAAVDASGVALQASEGFSVSIADPDIAGVRGVWDFSPPADGASTHQGDFRLDGRSPGATTLQLSAEGVSLAVPVEVK